MKSKKTNKQTKKHISLTADGSMLTNPKPTGQLWWGQVTPEVLDKGFKDVLLDVTEEIDVHGDYSIKPSYIYPTCLHSHCRKKWKTQTLALCWYERSLQSQLDHSQVTHWLLLCSSSPCTVDSGCYTSFSLLLISSNLQHKSGHSPAEKKWICLLKYRHNQFFFIKAY